MLRVTCFIRHVAFKKRVFKCIHSFSGSLFAQRAPASDSAGTDRAGSTRDWRAYLAPRGRIGVSPSVPALLFSRANGITHVLQKKNNQGRFKSPESAVRETREQAEAKRPDLVFGVKYCLTTMF